MCAKLTKKTKKKLHQVKHKDSRTGLEVSEEVGKLLRQK